MGQYASFPQAIGRNRTKNILLSFECKKMEELLLTFLMGLCSRPGVYGQTTKFEGREFDPLHVKASVVHYNA